MSLYLLKLYFTPLKTIFVRGEKDFPIFFPSVGTSAENLITGPPVTAGAGPIRQKNPESRGQILAPTWCRWEAGMGPETAPKVKTRDYEFQFLVFTFFFFNLLGSLQVREGFNQG